ncbi:MAG: hypothetical protein ACRDRP_01255 [Pseudonocardiaceae bacterium]
MQAYDVLERICTGLGVSRGAMGLSYSEHPGDSPVSAPSEEDEADVLRRQFQHLVTVAGVALFGPAIPGPGQPSPAVAAGQALAVPSRIGRADIKAIHDLTRAVADVARTVGGQAGPACSLADWADRCLAADASDAARQALLSELADLHVIAAYCCHDSYAPVLAYQHFTRAVELAIEAGDSYRASYALHYAAMMLIGRDQPNNALKLTQLAELHLANAPGDDPRVAPLRSQLVVVSALAQAQLADPGSAVAARRVRSELARSRDGWDPPSLHQRAVMDSVTSSVHLHLGALDIAEPMAAVSVRTFAQGNHGRDGLLAGITVARVHLLAGEPDAARLAAQAIEAVVPLRSGVARTALAPLARDLETRPGPDFAALARQARKITTTRI